TRSKRDWSSDVCSSDLETAWRIRRVQLCKLSVTEIFHCCVDRRPHDTSSAVIQIICEPGRATELRLKGKVTVSVVHRRSVGRRQIGRASCRERVEVWGD